MAITRAIVQVPQSLQSAQAGFLAQAIVVDNPTNQWYYEPNAHRFVPPFFGGVVIATSGVQAISLLNMAPAGLTQPPVTLGQELTVAFTSAELTDNPGIPLISPRSSPVDRNQVDQVLSYDAAAIAPHGATVRGTYTVPAGRKAQIELCSLSIVRDGVAAGPGLSQFLLRITTMPTMIAQLDNGALGAESDASIGVGPTLLVGNTVELITLDQSANGTISYAGSVWLSEFDA